MKTNTLLLLGAAAVALYFVTKGSQPAQQAARPGAQVQPPGPGTTYAANTAGPNSQGPTLVQQLGGGPGVADIVKASGDAAATIWDRIAGSGDSAPPDDNTPA